VDFVTDDKPPPWAPLSRRNAGLGPDETLHEGIPSHLRSALELWESGFRGALQEGDGEDRDGVDQADAIAKWWRDLYLRLGVAPPSDWRQASPEVRLDIIDAMLRSQPFSDEWAKEYVDDLERLLQEGNSAWRVNTTRAGLERRLNGTVTEAVRTTVGSATAAAADHLRTAWAETYGLHPDPDKAYAEAVKAVEAVACPVVLPTNKLATLGTVLGELRGNQATMWELTLPTVDGMPGAVAPVVGMMKALWEGQRSRHAGTATSRRQEQAEAEAAVHLAAVLVQWLTSGALRKKKP
jgi:hypothetical protein